jgi:hypothetical protein
MKEFERKHPEPTEILTTAGYTEPAGEAADTLMPMERVAISRPLSPQTSAETTYLGQGSIYDMGRENPFRSKAFYAAAAGVTILTACTGLGQLAEHEDKETQVVREFKEDFMAAGQCLEGAPGAIEAVVTLEDQDEGIPEQTEVVLKQPGSPGPTIYIWEGTANPTPQDDQNYDFTPKGPVTTAYMEAAGCDVPASPDEPPKR